MRALSFGLRPTWLRSRYGPWVRYHSHDKTSLYSVFGGYDDVVEELAALDADMNFVDVGANAGVISLIAAQKIGPTGICYSFEPNPLVAARLLENADKNAIKNIVLIPAALSAESTLVGMAYDRLHSGRAHVTKGISSLAVPALSLSDFAPDLVREIVARRFAIKIDVEGHEVQAITGLHDLLAHANCKFVIVEVSTSLLDRQGGSEAALTEAFSSLQFVPLRHSAKPHFNQVYLKRPC